MIDSRIILLTIVGLAVDPGDALPGQEHRHGDLPQSTQSLTAYERPLAFWDYGCKPGGIGLADVSRSDLAKLTPIRRLPDDWFQQ